MTEPVIQLDVLPTALAAAGVAVKPEWGLDGVNLLPFLTGRDEQAPHDTLYWRLGGQAAVRRGDWKLVRYDSTVDTPGRGRRRGRRSRRSARSACTISPRTSARPTTAARDYPDKAKELLTAWEDWSRATRPAPLGARQRRRRRRDEGGADDEDRPTVTPSRPACPPRHPRGARRPARRGRGPRGRSAGSPGRTSSTSWRTTWAGATSAGTAREIKTPNLDKLANAGARLEQFYVQPVCSPTRAALMTGRYPMRHGLQVGVVRPWAQYGLPLDERTLPAGPEAGGLRDGDRRQVAPRPLPARVPADPPRVRPPVWPLQRRPRLLHPHPRRRVRLAPRRPESAATRATAPTCSPARPSG